MAVWAAVALLLAMGQAERRARRRLFGSVGLDERTVELLMARNGDVLAELDLVRRQDPGSPTADPSVAAPRRAPPPIRLVPPPSEAMNHLGADPLPPPDPARPPADRRRLRLPGRGGRS